LFHIPPPTRPILFSAALADAASKKTNKPLQDASVLLIQDLLP
jgi:hypothetical protein